MTLPQDKTKPRREFLTRLLLTLGLIKTAFAFMIAVDGQIPLPGNEFTAQLTEKQISDGHSDRDQVIQVGQQFRQLVPNAESYLNESSYFHTTIATAAWGRKPSPSSGYKKQV